MQAPPVQTAHIIRELVGGLPGRIVRERPPGNLLMQPCTLRATIVCISREVTEQLKGARMTTAIRLPQGTWHTGSVISNGDFEYSTMPCSKPCVFVLC